MLKNYKDVPVFFKSISNGNMERYRSFRENIISKEISNISLLIKDKKKLSALQRSWEFFLIKRNILFFLKYFNEQKMNFIFTLPPSWIDHLNVSLFFRFISKLNFAFYVFYLSTKRLLKYIIQILFENNKTYTFDPQKYTYIGIVNNTDIFKDNSGLNAYRLTSWLEKNVIKKNNGYSHSIPSMEDKKSKDNLKYVKGLLPPLNILKRILVVFYIIPQYVFALLKLFLGDWKSLYMVDDLILEKYFLFCDKKDFFRNYVFHHVGTSFCPSWVNIVSKNKSKVYFLFNSSNSEPSFDGLRYNSFMYKSITWPNIVPFNEKFIDQVKPILAKNVKVLKTPTIRYSDCSEKINSYVKKPFLAIFDTQPVDPYYHLGISRNNNYIYHYKDKLVDYHIKFITDIINVAKKNNLQVTLKPKRFDKRVSENYLNLIKDLERKKDIIILPSRMSPYRIIDESKFSIAQPFTSVGHYENLNNKLVFFDAFNILPKHHDECFGTPLLSSKKELDKWISIHSTNKI